MYLLAGSLAPFTFSAVLAPPAIIAGWHRMQLRIACALYLALAAMALLISELVTGQPLFGSSVERAWYTPLIYVATYAALIAVLNAVPVGIFYALGHLIPQKKEGSSLKG